MGKSTINGHFQWLCQSLPEGIPIVYLIPIDGIKPVAIHGHPWPSPSMARRFQGPRAHKIQAGEPDPVCVSAVSPKSWTSTATAGW